MTKHSGTSNLQKHLEVKHPAFWAKIKGEENKTPSVKKFMSNTQKWRRGSKQCTLFDCSLTRFVVQTNSSLSIVDKECFREILHPQYPIPGSTYFTDTILNDVYKDKLEVIQDILKNIKYIDVQIEPLINYDAVSHAVQRLLLVVSGLVISRL